MEIQTSFIPKAPITTAAYHPANQSSVGFATVIGLVLALSSLAVFSGAFIYKQMLLQQITATETTIQDIRDNKMPAENLKRLEELNIKLTNANQLLDGHVSTNRIFTLLQNTTIPAVRYTSFNFSGNEVKVKGTAKSYEDVAAQAKVFSSEAFKNKFTAFEFSDFTVDKVTKLVSFSLALTVVPSEFRYTGEGAASSTPINRPTTTATTTPQI